MPKNSPYRNEIGPESFYSITQGNSPDLYDHRPTKSSEDEKRLGSEAWDEIIQLMEMMKVLVLDEETIILEELHYK